MTVQIDAYVQAKSELQLTGLYKQVYISMRLVILLIIFTTKKILEQLIRFLEGSVKCQSTYMYSYF